MKIKNKKREEGKAEMTCSFVDDMKLNEERDHREEGRQTE